ncbi:hypothetical protein SHJG_p250 (plasmid) [Streptomyces hygroscopicus subsp. jinggangensis 5008]|nr:hypothetical protein SHJG_p250 [Streptomyces hygroscopicus subsp. jinggangensis 5008]AGF68519.1 hypothetical protein SHJGH_p250 [Streptomyces hygroscopicus subsp. jinggangensis TL01]
MPAQFRRRSVGGRSPLLASILRNPAPPREGPPEAFVCGSDLHRFHKSDRE